MLSVGEVFTLEIRLPAWAFVASQAMSQDCVVSTVRAAALAISCCERLRRGREGSAKH